MDIILKGKLISSEHFEEVHRFCVMNNLIIVRIIVNRESIFANSKDKVPSGTPDKYDIYFVIGEKNIVISIDKYEDTLNENSKDGYLTNIEGEDIIILEKRCIDFIKRKFGTLGNLNEFCSKALTSFEESIENSEDKGEEIELPYLIIDGIATYHCKYKLIGSIKINNRDFQLYLSPEKSFAYIVFKNIYFGRVDTDGINDYPKSLSLFLNQMKDEDINNFVFSEYNKAILNQLDFLQKYKRTTNI